MKKFAAFSVLLACAFRPAIGAEPPPTELFVLWQGRGDWECSLSVTAGKILRAEPYMFLDARDQVARHEAQRIDCTTHSRGNAAGLHLFVAAGSDCSLRLETNRSTQQFKLAELPATEPTSVPLADGKGCIFFGRGDPAPGPRNYYRQKLPAIFVPPTPHDAVRVPPVADFVTTPIAVRFSAPPPGDLQVRRVAHNDGLLYLELFSSSAPLAGTAEIALGSARLGTVSLQHSLWLALEPRIGRCAIQVTSPSGPQTLSAPTTLVETRGPKIFLNGEPFLIKGTLPGDLPADDAEFIRSLGMNTLRGASAPQTAERYGFMAIASLQGRALKKLADYHNPHGREELAKDLEPYLASKAENARAAADSPNTLVMQLDNERTESGANPLDPDGNNTGADPWSDFVRGEDGDFARLDQILARGWNLAKPLAPMLPLGYANETQGYMAPEFLDVYQHNTYLPRDRYSIPFDEFRRLQSGERRPFINSEWGANRFTPEAYHGARNSPVLEKIQAWGYRQTWETFMAAGTVGGTCYKLYDSTSDNDQGTKSFGIMTADRQPKLACWELWHLWRDFEITSTGERTLTVTWKRDYAARDCRLTLSREGSADWSVDLGGFAPHDTHAVLLPFAASEARWRIAFTTHRSLPSLATGAWPAAIEESDFQQKLAKRDTVEFLRPLLTARVLNVEGRDAPPALVDMTVGDGIIPVAFRCADGSTYVTAFTRRRLHGTHYVKADIRTAFTGTVERVDEWTGKPVGGDVPHESTTSGITFKDVEIPSIPGPIGQRSNEPIALPVFRIRPATR